MSSASNSSAEWWKGAVIYQIYPRSFADSNGDGVGDLAGIIDRLGYVADLGVDGIWLSPFFTSPMADFGYDVADYRDVDPIFGTLADFDSFIARAHKLGLKVIVDQVYSHTSDRHEWFRESRTSATNDKADWYVWADAKEDGTPPNNWLSMFGGSAWSWDTSRRQYYLHNFLREQPDLNFHQPAVQDAILDITRFWLDRGVDGLRLDVANNYFHDLELRDNPASGIADGRRPYEFQHHRFNRSRPENLAFLERLRSVIDEYPDRMSVAEIASGSNLERSLEYTQGNSRLHTAYNFHFLESRKPAPGFVEAALEVWNDKDAWPSWSLSNHDVRRVLSRWSDGTETPERAKMLLALLLSMRGTIFLYQGEELGLPQGDVPFEQLRDPEAIRFWPDNLGRDGCRTPMPWSSEGAFLGFSQEQPWLPVDPRHRTLAADRQDGDAQSVLEYARSLIAYRCASQVLIRGDHVPVQVQNPDAIVFERRLGDERIVCAFNLSETDTATLDLTDLEESKPVETASLSSDIAGGRLVLAPNGVFIGRRQGAR
ncbi:alpha-glucosidase family protein [Erythrobacter rubeus]|uniref:Alpha-glucosidase n=1 Tax=Erythrobacter rubeus TaxID=2760803 RepID=A0ABR8KMS4_9SPHN|nr:alpha-glucosidase family protein [Erythrobacter rubeus]MBD2841898.1 alpha-glucosidase [Erythrobacter rubeus]